MASTGTTKAGSSVNVVVADRVVSDVLRTNISASSPASDGDALDDGLNEALGLTLALGERLGEILALGLTLGDTDADGETEGLTLLDGETDADGDTDADGLPVGDTDALTDDDGLRLADGLSDGLTLLDTDAEGEPVGDGDALADPDGLSDTLVDAEGDAEALGLCEADGLWLATPSSTLVIFKPVRTTSSVFGSTWCDRMTCGTRVIVLSPIMSRWPIRIWSPGSSFVPV